MPSQSRIQYWHYGSRTEYKQLQLLLTANAKMKQNKRAKKDSKSFAYNQGCVVGEAHKSTLRMLARVSLHVLPLTILGKQETRC